MLKLDNFQICSLILSYASYFILFLLLLKESSNSNGSAFNKGRFGNEEFKKIIFILISIVGGLPPFSFFSIKLFCLFTLLSSSYLMVSLLYMLYNIVFIIFYYNHFLIFTKILKNSKKSNNRRSLVLISIALLLNLLSLFIVNLMLF